MSLLAPRPVLSPLAHAAAHKIHRLYLVRKLGSAPRTLGAAQKGHSADFQGTAGFLRKCLTPCFERWTGATGPELAVSLLASLATAGFAFSLPSPGDTHARTIWGPQRASFRRRRDGEYKAQASLQLARSSRTLPSVPTAGKERWPKAGRLPQVCPQDGVGPGELSVA